MNKSKGINYCNKCLEEFTVNPKEKKYSRGIREVYFICPHCNERYTSFYTNAKVRRLQGDLNHLYHIRGIKIRDIAAKADNKVTNQEVEEIINEIEEYIDLIDEEIRFTKIEIEKEMNKLEDELK